MFLDRIYKVFLSVNVLWVLIMRRKFKVVVVLLILIPLITIGYLWHIKGPKRVFKYVLDCRNPYGFEETKDEFVSDVFDISDKNRNIMFVRITFSGIGNFRIYGLKVIDPNNTTLLSIASIVRPLYTNITISLDEKIEVSTLGEYHIQFEAYINGWGQITVEVIIVAPIFEGFA